ncbi:hypothetical protein, partial [uncultured Idiomarina sp.]|uniref:hypothetical protein n=1 Tax=uncultured Idiomarina sp. TaxID=352961 RepID=UPI0032B2CC9B
RREADANKACGKRSEPHPHLAAQPPSPHSSCTASRRVADANKACGKRSEPHPSLAAQPPSKLKKHSKKSLKFIHSLPITNTYQCNFCADTLS